jgi:hypothetical protein
MSPTTQLDRAEYERNEYKKMLQKIATEDESIEKKNNLLDLFLQRQLTLQLRKSREELLDIEKKELNNLSDDIEHARFDLGLDIDQVSNNSDDETRYQDDVASHFEYTADHD